MIVAPLVARAGSRVEVHTYITTKPQLPSGSVTATASHFGPKVALEVMGDGVVYPVPGQNNEYAVIHSFLMPRNHSSGDYVVYHINMTDVPSSRFCFGKNNVLGSIGFIDGEAPL